MSRVWPFLHSFLSACRQRLFARETLLCALALSPLSLVIMLKFPVLWRDYDGLGQITAPPGHLIILAQPPLYPFLSRLPILFVSALSGLAHPHSLEVNLNRPVTPKQSRPRPPGHCAAPRASFHPRSFGRIVFAPRIRTDA